MIFQVKKLFALILSFVLCFNLCAPAFAAETELPEENQSLVALGAAIAASIVQGTTATASLIVQSVSEGYSPFIKLFDEFVTADEDIEALYGSGERFAQAIAEASSFSDVGDIIIEGVMNGKIYRFVEWLKNQYNLIAGGSSSVFYTGQNILFSDGFVLPFMRYTFENSDLGRVISGSDFFPFSAGTIYYLANGNSFYIEDNVYYYKIPNVSTYYSLDISHYLPSNTTIDSYTFFGGTGRGTIIYLGIPDSGGMRIAWGALTSLEWTGYSNVTGSFTPLSAFYDIPSEIPDNQGLTIDTNISDLDMSDPQTTADTIFQFIIDGNYIPVVSVGDIPVIYDPQIIASQFSVTSTTFTSSVSLTGLDPSHEYKPFWALYNKADTSQVIASGYAAEIGTVTGVGSYSGYFQVTNLTPSTAYLISWTLLDSTANEIVPSVSNLEFTTFSNASSDDSPSILLMILNKVSEILDKMNGGQSEGFLASINEKLDLLIDTVANQYERELEDNFKDSLSGVNENFFSETGKGQGVTVSDVVDLADTQGVFKDIFSGDYGFSDFLDLFSDDGFSPWFSSDTAMNLNPTAYGSPSAADLDDPYNMQSYYDNVEKVRNKSND